ncbi:MAG: dihydrofolate reductase, partial [Opitutae bacterium]|nr:dihydrofolate reductase [Opitutae bacterium]
MRKLIMFNNVSLDGCFTDARGDMSWAHKDPQDKEWNDFTAANAGGRGTLVFGRVTYELMAGFWPTPMAKQMMPEVAAGMNRMPKVVFSRTLRQVTWENTRLMKGDLVTEMRKLKKSSDRDLVILGSGSLVAQLAPAGLIDEFRIVVAPLALGRGRTLFDGIKQRLPLKLAGTRT